MKKWFFLLIFSLFVLSCARVGSPVGGAKDSLAPKFLSANIDSSRVNVPTGTKELRLYFDEYVNLKEVSKNLIISPPIKKIKKILPSNLANKFILIQWEDDLLPNTTYNFNFGNSIADLNEGNILPYFNYAFSTGEKLDELYISGDVVDGLSSAKEKKDSKKNYVVGLYKDSDSLDYKQKPYYIAKADKDGYFELNYLSPGVYRIVAFDDENQNSVFEAGKEAVSFNKEKINLEKSISGMKLRVFPSKKPVKYLEYKEVPGGILMLFEGKPQQVEVKSLSEKLKDYKVTHQPKSDSVNIWFDATKQNIGIEQSEKLEFSYHTETKQDTISMFYKKSAKSEFTIANAGSNVLPPNKDFVITSSLPVENIQAEKWTMKKDSTAVNFSAKISETNPFEIKVSGNFEPKQKYQLTVPKSTVSSFYETLPKSYQFNFEIDLEENYGSFTLNLQNKPAQKFWVQFLDDQEKVQYSKFTADSTVKFTEIKPGKYNLRILVDNNGNGYWDEADFANQVYAEDSYLFSKTIEIRPLWENVESWDLAAPEEVKPLENK